MKIKLRNSDLFALVRVFTKASRAHGGLRGLLIASESRNDTQTEGKTIDQLGIAQLIAILWECLSVAEYEMQEWLSGLCDMDIATFLAQPGTFMLDLFKEIAEGEETKSFFRQASALYSGTFVSGTPTTSD